MLVQPTELFALGLGLTSPWKIVDFEFLDGEVHIYIDFERGAKFDGLPVHDTSEKVWRHLNFFKYPCFVHARVPRVISEDDKVSTVDVPWAKPGIGFTSDFEAFALSLVCQMPVSPAARILSMTDTRLWRLLHRYVQRCRESLDIGQPVRIGVDETSSKRGHNYITVFVDLDAKRVLFACEGRSSIALKQFRRFLSSKGANPKKVREFSSDMSPAFLSGINEYFPKAKVTLDKYHLVAMVSRAVDETRKLERGKSKEYKKTKWLWLKNPMNLTAKEQTKLTELLELNAFPITGKAYGLKLAFQEFFKVPKRQAESTLSLWLAMVWNANIHHMNDVAATFFNERDKILRWFESKISNGILEGLHSVLQATKNKARGYRNPQNLITMSYLLHGKLKTATHTK